MMTQTRATFISVRHIISALGIITIAMASSLAVAQGMPPQPDQPPAGFSGTLGEAPAPEPAPVPAAPQMQAGQMPEAAKSVVIADQTVALPKIAGYREIYGEYPQFDKIMLQFVPPTNRLQAFYLSDTDYENLQKNPNQGFHDYIMVQSLAQDMVIRNADDFTNAKNEIKKSLQSTDDMNAAAQDMVDKANGFLSQNYNVNAQLKIGATRVVAIPVDDDLSLSMTVLANYAVSTAQGTRGVPMVMSLNIMNVNSRALFVFAYNSYKDQADVDAVTRTAQQYRRELFALNGVSDSSAASPVPVQNSADGGPQAQQMPAEDDAAAAKTASPLRWLNIAIVGGTALILLLVLIGVFSGKGKLRDIILGHKEDTPNDSNNDF